MRKIYTIGEILVEIMADKVTNLLPIQAYGMAPSPAVPRRFLSTR